MFVTLGLNMVLLYNMSKISVYNLYKAILGEMKPALLKFLLA